jgi:hypothetical protein
MYNNTCIAVHNIIDKHLQLLQTCVCTIKLHLNHSGVSLVALHCLQAEHVVAASEAQPILCGSYSKQLAESIAAAATAAGSPTALRRSSSSINSKLCRGRLSPLPAAEGPVTEGSSLARALVRGQLLADFFAIPGHSHVLWQLAGVVSTHLQAAGGHQEGAGGGGALGRSISGVAGGIGHAGLTSSFQQLHISGRNSSSSSSSFSPAAAPGAGLAITSSTSSSSALASYKSAIMHGEAKGLVHASMARSTMLSRANQVELTAGTGRGLGGSKRDAMLEEAAVLHLTAGNVEQCCELYVQVGALVIKRLDATPMCMDRRAYWSSDKAVMHQKMQNTACVWHLHSCMCN